MLVKFGTNLGRDEAAACNLACGTKINFKECTKDAEVDIPESAVEWLSKKHGPDQVLVKPVESVRGVAKKPEVTAPAK